MKRATKHMTAVTLSIRGHTRSPVATDIVKSMNLTTFIPDQYSPLFGEIES
jgi:hypothetical protein